MTAPDLHGIDPDALYPWSPARCFVDRNEARRMAAKDAILLDSYKDLPEAERLAILSDFEAPVVLDLVPGSPVVLLKPLLIKHARKIDAARQKQARITSAAQKRAAALIIKSRIEGESEEARDERSAQIIENELNAAADESSEVWALEIQHEILAACIAGWEGFKAKFTGDMDRNLAAIPSADRAAIFWAIVTESAWTAEAREGFTSPQA